MHLVKEPMLLGLVHFVGKHKFAFKYQLLFSVATSVLVLLSVLAVGYCVTPVTVLSVEEQSKIKDQLIQDLPGKDLITAYYNVASLKLLNSNVPKSEVSHFNSCFCSAMLTDICRA